MAALQIPDTTKENLKNSALSLAGDIPTLLNLVNYGLNKEEAEEFMPELIAACYASAVGNGDEFISGLSADVRKVQSELRLEHEIKVGKFDRTLRFANLICERDLTSEELSKIARNSFLRKDIESGNKASEVLKKMTANA